MSFTKNFHKQILPIRHKLYRFALRLLGNVEEAEDVVQEVLLKIWKGGEQLSQLENAEAWCMRITKNLSLDKIKSGYRKILEFPGSFEDGYQDAPSPAKQVHLNDTMGRLKQLMDALPKKQKMIIQLRDIEGYSYKEISEILEISIDQVKVNLHRGRKFIKSELIKVESYGT